MAITDMAINVKPTKIDIWIADIVAANAEPAPEALARVLSYGADEKLLLALAGAFWICAQKNQSPARRSANHLLIVTAVTSAMPHLLKAIFNQRRPDRRTIRGHRRGIPISGKPDDAFPSGHAVHMGALASAATLLPKPRRNLVWGATVGLALTRIFILAHWASDVVAGFALGVLTERVLRGLTGYPGDP
jgi:membrane-associated phospholipid phosphatase